MRSHLMVPRTYIWLLITVSTFFFALILWVIDQSIILRTIGLLALLFVLPGVVWSFVIFPSIRKGSIPIRLSFALVFGFVVNPLGGYYIEKFSGIDESNASIITAIVSSGIAATLLLHRRNNLRRTQ